MSLGAYICSICGIHMPFSILAHADLLVEYHETRCEGAAEWFENMAYDLMADR